MQHKTCKQCGRHKPLTDYYLTRGTPFARCKPCCIENSKAKYRANPETAKASRRARYLANPERDKAYARGRLFADPRVRMAAAARKRDRAKGLPSDIEAEQIVIPGTCPVLGIALTTAPGRCHSGSPSIDHVDPTKGAIKGNWRVISHRANHLKGTHSAASLATHIAAIEAGTKALRGRVVLEEYRAVLRYLNSRNDL